MGMTKKEITQTINIYDCDFCPTRQSVFQKYDEDSYTLPKGWKAQVIPGQPSATIGEVICPACVNCTKPFIEGRLTATEVLEEMKKAQIG